MKQSVWLIWLGSGAAILWGSGWISSVGHFVFWATLIAHIVEFFVKRSVMEAAGGSMANHFCQTLIYGLFHWKPLEEEAAATDSG
ncbi:MAG: hypothetical protein JRH01_15980 [Deltaproteobacteria bacterium]|nr:hypothetical protein [Deltaproteobacteria bacterium]MBW2392778.1 hypothetical protein [Deltaproteobacteria bacterium]